MTGYLWKKIELLLDSVVEPIVDLILSMSWTYRVAALTVLAIVIGWITHPEVPAAAIRQVHSYSRVLTAGPSRVPLRSSLVEGIGELNQRLSLLAQTELSQVGRNMLTPWSAAQGLRALGPLADDPEPVIAFIRRNTLAGCACWTEIMGRGADDVWTHISGWVMAAFADLGVAATGEEVQYLLDQQNEMGFWAAFPGAGADHASTYATAWAIVGLQRQQVASLLSPPHEVEVADAIHSGAAWLLSRRQGARWAAYPDLPSDDTLSASISGLALHSLHLAVPELVTQLDRDWIDTLPEDVVPASAQENYYLELHTANQVGIGHIDHFVQLTMPWMLIATVDAFASGSPSQRSRALLWIEDTLAQNSVTTADALTNWWRAEVHYSLRYALDREKIKTIAANPGAGSGS